MEEAGLPRPGTSDHEELEQEVWKWWERCVRKTSWRPSWVFSVSTTPDSSLARKRPKTLTVAKFRVCMCGSILRSMMSSHCTKSVSIHRKLNATTFLELSLCVLDFVYFAFVFYIELRWQDTGIHWEQDNYIGRFKFNKILIFPLYTDRIGYIWLAAL